MEDVNRDPATQEEQVEGQPGSEEFESSGGTPDEEEVGEGTDLNPKAFKGLQRRLSAKDRELEEARRQVQELQSKTASGALSVEEVVQLVRPVIDSIKQDNPELARQMAVNIAATIDARNNQSAQQELAALRAKERQQAEEQDVLSDLRELASDMGADPDDEELDYGDPSMSLRERMKLVRQSAKELSQPAKPAPKPKSNTGAAVSSNQGSPPSPKPKTPTYTKADLDRELAAYTDTHKRQHLEKAGEIRAALVAQAEANLHR